MAAKLSILTFPQKLEGNSLFFNVLIIPRNIDPTQPLQAGSPAFQSANITLQAKIISDLSVFPSDLVTSTPKPLTGTGIPSSAPDVFATLAAQFHIDPVVERAPDPDPNHFIQKYLPLSYRNAFNFTNPRTSNAKTDDSYACAVRSTVPNPAFQPSDPLLVSWGQVFAYLLRQPDLASSVGFIQSSFIDVSPDLFVNGGWLWIDLDPASDFYAESQADKTLIKKYAARIPALTIGKDRNIFAAVQFPVLFKANPGDPDPSPGPGLDPVFLEASEYDTGFSKIVHTYQPVNNNFIKEEEDPESLPTKDLGVRLGWDDEQLLIWQNRQMVEDPSKPGSKLRVDAPLGVSKYRIDTRIAVPAGQPANPWTSLSRVEAASDIALGATLITTKGTKFEMGTEVYPSQINGDTTSNFWLPSYFTQWIGKSLVVPDADAAVLYKTDQAGAPLQTLYTPLGEGHPGLIYGNIYDFRVRMTDFTGGGPGVTDDPDPDNQGPAPISTLHFKRYVAPAALLWADNPINGDPFTGTSLKLFRPRLGYPAVVFTNKYPDPITLLKADANAAAGDPVTGKIGRDFGLPDPDVIKVAIVVEVKTLYMDNQLSASGKEPYITLYTTSRSFPADFNSGLTIPIRFLDATVLALGDPTNLNPLGLAPGEIDTLDEIVLPTARDIRITIRGICASDMNYFGSTLTPTGAPLSFFMRQESTSEANLFAGTGAENQLQGIYLQPDPPPIVYNEKSLVKAFLGDLNVNNPPDMVQRLANQLGVDNKAFTLIGKQGKQVQFGCSRAIRHSLSPDSSNITFSTKNDLLSHWIVAINLVLDRDWTWDAVKPDSFLVQRVMKFRADGAINGTETPENVGYIRLGSAAGITALTNPDRSQLNLIYLDAVEPKPQPGDFPDIIELQYQVIPQFKSSSEVATPLTLTLELPVTTNPADLPVLASAGIASTPYIANSDYSATEAREKHLWFEFKEPPADPNDSFFIRLLNYSPDPLLATLTTGVLENTLEPALSIDPELIRAISSGNDTDDEAGLDAMQEMIPSIASPKHFLIPLPPGLHAASPELFGMFTYEIRIGHKRIWTTAQGRFGRQLRMTGVQHPAPTLFCSVNRDELSLSVSAPHAMAVFNGTNLTAQPPRTNIWALLYAQVTQADGKSKRNILISQQPMRDPAYYNFDFRLNINKDAPVYSLTLWSNTDIADILSALGLPVTSSLSVLCVEMLPTPDTYPAMVSTIVDTTPISRRAQTATLATGTTSPASLSAFGTTKSQPSLNTSAPASPKSPATPNVAAAGNFNSADRESVGDAGPLAGGLGQFRILRTSPLTPVPFVCCT